MKTVLLWTKKLQKTGGILYPKMLLCTGFMLVVNQASESQSEAPGVVDDLALATNTALRTKWLLAVVKGKVLSEQG